MKNDIILTTSGVTITVKNKNNTLELVKNINLQMKKGKILGLVGESGCGKTIIALAILGLLPKKEFKVSGEVLFNGMDMYRLTDKERRKILGNEISMIFQEPMTSLNPLIKVGKQISESLYIHKRMKEKEAYPLVVEAMNIAGLPEPEDLYHYYPHQLSGGLRQRVMIAMALVCKPNLIIADEPTTALDAMVQKEILLQLKKACKELNTAMLFISHDLGVIKNLCEDVAVLYLGSLLEYGECTKVLNHPKNEYTKALLASIPSPELKGKMLKTIPGIVPPSGYIIKGCKFAKRCGRCTDLCKEQAPLLRKVDTRHYAACHSKEG
ncbi:MAG: ABC transporter ATP-binding protein [Anaerocolumna sp.]